MSTLRIEIPPKLIPVFAPNLGEVRYRVMYGGRGSGKSFTAAKMAAIQGAVRKLRILCTRELQNSIKESFHMELKNAIASDPWLSSQYDVGVDFLRHKTNGTEFIFKGLRHNIEGVKSMAQIDVLIVEEAETVPHASWTDLLPTIRSEGSEVWIIFNPKARGSWVAQTFIENEPPPRTVMAQLNWQDNPWFSRVLQEQRDHAHKTMTPEMYNHVWEGGYLEAEDGTIIRRSWIEKCIDAHMILPDLQWGGSRIVGYDVADDGGDKNATTSLYGSIIESLDEWSGGEDELVKSTARVITTAKGFKANHIGYDSIGVGAGVGSIMNERKWLKHYKFNAGAKVAYPDKWYDKGSKVKNGDMFSNLKAQAWWNLSDRFRNTFNAITKGYEYPADEMISISSKIPRRELNKLVDELSTPLRDFDRNGRVKVESKDDLARRDVKSPNIGDSVVIATAHSLLTKRSILDMLR